MVRIIGFLIGLGLAGVLLLSLVTDGLTYFSAPPEETAEHKFHKYAEPLALSTDGPFGKFDKAQLQRGLKVYTEVCAACHGINQVRFFDLK